MIVAAADYLEHPDEADDVREALRAISAAAPATRASSIRLRRPWRVWNRNGCRLMRAYLPDFAVVNLAELHEALDALASAKTSFHWPAARI